MCDHSNRAFVDGRQVCTGCGLELSAVQYVTSYSRQQCFRRHTPVYSRQKRFFGFINAHSDPVVNQHIEEIITLFTHIVFAHGIFPPKNRKYFFNRNVTLAFIVFTLGYDVTGLKTLKDKDRVICQMNNMRDILIKTNLM